MEENNIGFTGTLRGATVAQMATFRGMFSPARFGKADEFHHGNARGADKQMHLNVLENMLAKEIHLHPAGGKIDHGLNRLSVAISATYKVSVVMYAHRPPLVRNHDIVDAVGRMIATPKGYKEELRSGTWATIRYALKCNKPTTIIWPDGSLINVTTLSMLRLFVGGYHGKETHPA